MSTLKVNSLTNGGSAIDLPNGLDVGGNPIVQGYTESATEPSSPVTGDFWWDTANEVLYQYLNGEFKEIGIVLPADPWDFSISGLTYDSVSLSVSSQDTNPVGIVFSTDGTKMYVMGYANKAVYQYSLSTGFDLSTASYVSSFYAGSQDSAPSDVQFSTDGTKMYLSGFGSDNVYQYNLSTAWNITTASYNSSFSVVSQDATPLSLSFGADGTKMYVTGNTNDSIYQYTLSTAWNLSTASYDSVSLSVSAQTTTPRGTFLHPTGTKLYVVGSNTGFIYQYTMSTAWDLSTASYDSVSLDVSAQDTAANNIYFSVDGTKMYLSGNTTDTIYQYSTG